MAAFKEREPKVMYDGDIIVFRFESYEHFTLGKIERVVSEREAVISYWKLGDGGFMLFSRRLIIGECHVELFDFARHSAIKDALVRGWNAAMRN